MLLPIETLLPIAVQSRAVELWAEHTGAYCEQSP
jgi:hypothetical protein